MHFGHIVQSIAVLVHPLLVFMHITISSFYSGQTSPQEVKPKISSDHTYSIIGRLRNDPLPQLPSVYTLTRQNCNNQAPVFHCRSDSELDSGKSWKSFLIYLILYL